MNKYDAQKLNTLACSRPVAKHRSVELGNAGQLFFLSVITRSCVNSVFTHCYKTFRHSDGLRAGLLGSHSRQEREIFLCYSVQTGPGALFPEVNRPGREANGSPSRSEVNNGGAVPPLPPYVFMTWYVLK